MKVKIRKVYYKRIKSGRDPVRFEAVQPNGLNTDVHAVVKIDPILKKYPDLRKPMLQHEKHELVMWGKGHADAHSHAKRKEPKRTRCIGGVKGFWSEIKKREYKRRK
jgi:hypothetical protein